MAADAWTDECLFISGDAYFSDILQGIAQARECIEFETYIYDDDAIGRQFETALIDAASRGIHVRLLVDGIGAGAWVGRRAFHLEHKGVAVRVYHPVRITSAFRRLLVFFGLRRRAASQSTKLLSRLNRRDHRKTVVIDRQKAWVGSLNISAVHSERYSGELAWRDTGIRVQGPGLAEIRFGFEYAWARSHDLTGRRHWSESLLGTGRQLPGRNLTGLVRSNFTVLLRRRGYLEFLRRLDLARERIWITNAYLAPSGPIIRRLNRARRRGVDVRLLVPRKSDVFFMPWVATSYYAEMLDEGVRIFEYLPRFLHAKSILIDDWAAVGSSNLNRRSLLRDFEIDIVVSDEKELKRLAEIFPEDLNQSEEITSAPGGLKAWLGRLTLYLMKEYI